MISDLEALEVQRQVEMQEKTVALATSYKYQMSKSG